MTSDGTFKRNVAITAAMGTTMLALSYCSAPGNDWEDVTAHSDTAVCVDQNGQRIEDDNCPGNSGRGGGGGYYRGGGRWYYMPRRSMVPLYGDSVREQRFAGGSFDATPGVEYFVAPDSTHMTRSQAVSRGGLGSGGRRYGGGWG